MLTFPPTFGWASFGVTGFIFGLVSPGVLFRSEYAAVTLGVFLDCFASFSIYKIFPCSIFIPDMSITSFPVSILINALSVYTSFIAPSYALNSSSELDILLFCALLFTLKNFAYFALVSFFIWSLAKFSGSWLPFTSYATLNIEPDYESLKLETYWILHSSGGSRSHILLQHIIYESLFRFVS